MLSLADAFVVAHDPNLPGLRLALDADALSIEMRRTMPHLGHPEVDLTYVRYKPGTNCLAAFTTHASGCHMRGYLKAYRTDAYDKLAKSAERPDISCAKGTGRAVLPGHAAEIVLFPNDNKLKSIARLSNPSDITRVAAHLFPDAHRSSSARIRYLCSKPERRYVMQLLIEEESRAVLKLYADDVYTHAECAANALATESAYLGSLPRYRALAFRWREGTALSDVLGVTADWPERVAQTGAVLAQLHRCTNRLLRTRERTHEVETIRATTETLRRLNASLGLMLDQIKDRLITQLQAAPTVATTIHGDFYSRQVLVGESGIELLDLDEAVLGDPAADLGLFLAHLEVDALCGRLTPAQVDTARAALLNGYGSIPQHVPLYTALGLLQLAPHHFRKREQDWPERMQATLLRAVALLKTIQVVRS